jgi:hypothetical protein
MDRSFVLTRFFDRIIRLIGRIIQLVERKGQLLRFIVRM